MCLKYTAFSPATLDGVKCCLQSSGGEKNHEEKTFYFGHSYIVCLVSTYAYEA